MKLKEEHIDKIAKLIFSKLNERKLIKLRKTPNDLINKVKQVMSKDLSKDSNLEEEARKLLVKFQPQIDSGVLDEGKALMMIKKQLAKERGEVL